MAETLASFYKKEPYQWGLRGDPHLWKEMREHFAQIPIPARVDELVRLIETTFETLTRRSMSEKDNFFVQRFSHGGQFSGMISPEFWRNQVIPMMREQLDDRSN